MIISVIIPVFKVENYIQRCLESLITQECNDFDIECILVDDCSPDMSIAVAKEIIDQYNGSIRFRILSNKENQGVSISRNNGLMSAKGDYIFFMDSDDYLSKNCLSCLYREIYQYGCVVDMVIGNTYDYQNEKYWQKRDTPSSLLTNHDDILRRFLRIELPMMAWNKLIRRQFLLDNHLLFYSGILHEDELWSYELYNLVNSVVLVQEVTYHYEQNMGSIMNSMSNLVSRVEGYYIIVSNVLNTLCHDLYVDRFFWGIYMYMHLNAIVCTGGMPSDIISKITQLRRKLLYRSLVDCRLFILLFLLLTVQPPLCWLKRYRWFRHRYDGIRKRFLKLALAFDSFHKKSW